MLGVRNVQTDGNLVLYKTQNYNAIWFTSTSNYRNYAPFKFVIQEDGNMVLYDKDGTARWNSGTVQKPKGFAEDKKEKTVWWKVELRLQTDGNLVLYREDGKVLWSSGTQGRKDVGGAGHASLTGGVNSADGALLKEDSHGKEASHASTQENFRQDAREEGEARRQDDERSGEAAELEVNERGVGYMGGVAAADEDSAITYGADTLSSFPKAGEEALGLKLHTQLAHEARQAAKRERRDQKRSSHRSVDRSVDKLKASRPNAIQEVIDSLV